MKPRRRLVTRLFRALMRGLGWRRGWDDGPRVLPLHRERAGLFAANALRETPSFKDARTPGDVPSTRDAPTTSLTASPGERGPTVHGEPGLGEETARYAVRPEGHNLRRFTARGDQPRLTQVLMEATRSLPGSLGLVLVEVHGQPRERTTVDMDRSRLLQGLVELRDLLGDGGLDMAVFSPDESVEVFLDRFATLEIRCGAWHEPRFRGLFEAQGFHRVERLSPLPLAYQGAPPWSEEDGRRVEEVCVRLGLETVRDSSGANDAG